MHIHKNNLRTLVAQSLIALSILAVSGYARSQELPKDDQKSRPKIGLVLEGGGALGLAHIGVITWMEEHHIPVSYIAGTSMGGWSEEYMQPADHRPRSGKS
jgi:NTE family protein